METDLVFTFVWGCLFFPISYMIIFNLLKRYNYYALSDTDIYVISEQLVSIIQAFLACVSGAIIVYNCQNDVLRDKYWLTNSYAIFGTPYFYYDVGIMIMIYSHLHPTLEDISWYQMSLCLLRDHSLMLLHHIVFPIIYLPVIVWWRRDQGDFFVGCLYLIELAVPALSLRIVLRQLQMKDTKLDIINGLVLIVTWLGCRVLIFPFMYWVYGRQCGAPLWNVFMLIPKKCNIGCLLLIVFQIYWLVVMLKIAFKTLFSSAKTFNHTNKFYMMKQS